MTVIWGRMNSVNVQKVVFAAGARSALLMNVARPAGRSGW